MTKIPPPIKRRYNLCYRARQKGYTINTPERTMYRPSCVDDKIERLLNDYGFFVQTTLFDL